MRGPAGTMAAARSPTANTAANPRQRDRVRCPSAAAPRRRCSGRDGWPPSTSDVMGDRSVVRVLDRACDQRGPYRFQVAIGLGEESVDGGILLTAAGDG